MKTRKHHIIPGRVITSDGEKHRVIEDFGADWLIVKNPRLHFVVVHKNRHTRRWDSLEWTTTEQGARDALLRRLSSWRDPRASAIMRHVHDTARDPNRVKGMKRREFLRSFRSSGHQFQGQEELSRAEQRRAASQALRAHNYRACRKAGHRNCEHILYKGGVVPEARPWEMDPSRASWRTSEGRVNFFVMRSEADKALRRLQKAWPHKLRVSRSSRRIPGTRKGIMGWHIEAHDGEHWMSLTSIPEHAQKRHNVDGDTGAEAVSWGPYTEYGPAQERAMKAQGEGVRGLRIDKGPKGWTVKGVQTK